MINSKEKFLLDKIKNKQMEVEDLLEFVKGTKDDIPTLLKHRNLIIQNEINNSNTIPFSDWINQIVSYLNGGYNELITNLFSNKNQFHFILGVVEKSKSLDGLIALLEIISKLDMKSEIDYKIYKGSLSAINSMISFDNDILISQEVSDALRDSIHNFINHLIKKKYSEPDLVIAYCALRKVGNEESLKIIKQIPKLKLPENLGLESLVVNQIRKNLK